MLSATPTWHRVASGSITSHKLACSTAAHTLTSLLMPHATVWHSHAALATCGLTRSADSIAFSFSSRRVGIDSPASYLLHLHVASTACCNNTHTRLPRRRGHVGENHLHANRAGGRGERGHLNGVYG